MKHIKKQRKNSVESSQKLRSLGDIMLDLEPIIQEMTHEHDMQWYEILNLIRGYLEVHCPSGREEYEDGTHPAFFYGAKEE